MTVADLVSGINEYNKATQIIHQTSINELLGFETSGIDTSLEVLEKARYEAEQKIKTAIRLIVMKQDGA